MTNLNHFRNSFERAVARSKVKQVARRVQRLKTVDSNAITKAGNVVTTKKTTFVFNEEEYRTSIIAKAIAHINMQKGVI